MKPDFFFPLDHAAWPVLWVSHSGQVQKANAAAVQLFGTGLEAGAALLATIWGPENEFPAEAFLPRLERAPTHEVLLQFRLKDGALQRLPVCVSRFQKDENKGWLMQVLLPSLFAGISAPRNTPPQNAPKDPLTAPSTEFLAQKHKLDCALQLARTVALDFNNALTIVLGHTSLVLSQMDQNHPWRKSLLEVEKSAEKAAEIAHDLAAFSLQQKENRRLAHANLNTLLQQAAGLFKNNPNLSIEWKWDLEPKLFTALIDEVRMQQVLAKVLENANEAIPGSGSILIRTRNHSASPGPEANQLPEGNYVLIEIEDSGEGIPPDVLPKVFEPFFTTKKNHRGLGLAWAYGVLTNHGGRVSLTSQPGKGSTVTILLPALRSHVHEKPASDEDLKGSATILLVDDEELLLTMGETVLSSYGYKVITANSAARAIEQFMEHFAEIQLVITDMVMPGVSGRELIEQLQALVPDVRILCISGFARHQTPATEQNFLQKPFTSQDLLRKLKELLPENPPLDHH
jgi:two-component system, cell cycle sensor histidine kinase and response regulator CckA